MFNLVGTSPLCGVIRLLGKNRIIFLQSLSMSFLYKGFISKGYL